MPSSLCPTVFLGLAVLRPHQVGTSFLQAQVGDAFWQFVAQAGGLLRFASRRLNSKAKFAVIFVGCVGVADVARGEDNFPLLCGPIGSAEELGGSSASGLVIIMASVPLQ
jgi:hypothetical protein